MRDPANSINLGLISGTGTALALSPASRSTHLYLCGGTGAGKSKLLEYLVRQDIKRWPDSRSGLLLLDPHGSVYNSMVAWMASPLALYFFFHTAANWGTERAKIHVEEYGRFPYPRGCTCGSSPRAPGVPSRGMSLLPHSWSTSSKKEISVGRNRSTFVAYASIIPVPAKLRNEKPRSFGGVSGPPWEAFRNVRSTIRAASLPENETGGSRLHLRAQQAAQTAKFLLLFRVDSCLA